MNSSELQKQFPEVYQEFFLNCQKVASAPHSFFWSGDFSGFYGGLTISSKIPLRFYVGLEQISKDEFEINQELKAFFPAQKKFKTIKLEPQLANELRDLLSGSLRGYRVHLLTELTLGLSLGGLGALSAALSGLIKPGASLEKKFNIAKMIVGQIQTGRTSAATAYCSLSPSAYPTVFYQSGAKWWGKSLDELTKLPKTPVWPFDFGLIFSGNLVQGAAVIRSAEDLKYISQEREKEIAKLVQAQTTSFWDIYIKMLDQLGKQTLLDFVNVFKSGSDTVLRRFFEGLNQYQNLLHFLEISTANIDRIYSMIHRLSSKDENQIGSGCKITGVGKGGEVLFAMPFGRYRDRLEDMINEIDGASLDFASWRGGVEREGVRIEQDLVNQIHSFFSSQATALVKIYSKNQTTTKLVFEKNSPIIADLVLDKTNGKILYRNKQVKSSELPSQKATVDILSRLLESEGLILRNDALGSYGKSRYDLQGKITTPLSKVCSLNFEITGGAYDDYSLRLKSFDLKIAVISAVK